MLKEETSDACGVDAGSNNWARVCDTCRSAACTVYCRADSAYLCDGCDARVHAANRLASRHERVWVCEACERAPAAFLCKADAASLCTTCDAEIHSANSLARRHQRVPILPISGCIYGPSATDQSGRKMASATGTEDGFMPTEGDETIAEEDEDEAASWLLLNPGKNSTNQNNGFLFNGEVDEYLDQFSLEKPKITCSTCNIRVFTMTWIMIPQKLHTAFLGEKRAKFSKKMVNDEWIQ